MRDTDHLVGWLSVFLALLAMLVLSVMIYVDFFE